MTKQDHLNDVLKIIESAKDGIWLMFKQNKAKEIKFQIPLVFKFITNKGTKYITIPKISCKDETVYLLDEKDFAHPYFELVNDTDICRIYNAVYDYFYNNINVARNLQ